MYPVVYDWVHMCTMTYTTEYIYVLCRVRLCVYIFTNFDRIYVMICTITASLCTISELRWLREYIARYVWSLHHWVRSVRYDHSAKISYNMYDHCITGYDQWDAITQRIYRTICTITASLGTISEVRLLSKDIERYVRSLHHWVRSVRYDHSAKISYGMYNHSITGYKRSDRR